MDDGRRQVMDAGRAVMEKGLTWGTSGNISLREGDRVWITASGTPVSYTHLGGLGDVELGCGPGDVAALVEGLDQGPVAGFHNGLSSRSIIRFWNN